MVSGRELVRRLGRLRPGERARVVGELAAADLRAFDADWPGWAHAGQQAPEGDRWRVWAMLGGRGFGKTRAGAEWVSRCARDHPEASIALVGATPDEARRIMVEGPSGLLAVARPEERARMRWEPSRRRLVFASGARAFLYSGARADGLRGPEHHFAWCDELAKWRQAEAAWDNLMLGLRLGARPRALVTTTPRTIPLLSAILADAETARTGGATGDNPHLPDIFVESMMRRYAGTRLGRQEMDGELIADLEGALWTRSLIEQRRAPLPQAGRTVWRRVVIGVDPPASIEGVCGIVVCALAGDAGPSTALGTGFVLADESVGGVSPKGWARRVADAAERWRAHRVIAEANNGGRMVASVLKGAAAGLPLKLVHASEGKSARAEPVAALFESGQARFGGRFPELEDQLCGLIPGGRYDGPGKSPDRADAMVWAMTALMLQAGGTPRIREL